MRVISRLVEIIVHALPEYGTWIERLQRGLAKFLAYSNPDELLNITPEIILRMNAKIRCVELVSEFGELIFQKMRDGIKSISPDQLDEEFLAIGPNVIVGFCQKYEPWYGSLRGIVVYHDKVSILIIKVRREFLVLSFERETTAGMIKEVADEIYSKWGK